MRISIREATDTDLIFVVESWLDSYRNSHCAGLISMDDWKATMRPALRKVLGREGVTILVAHFPSAKPGVADVSGWLAFEHGYSIPMKFKRGRKHVREMVKPTWPLIHYCFTKKHYRKLGIQRALLAKAGIDLLEPFYFTCKTAAVGSLRIPRAKFNPLIARYPREKDNGTESEESETRAPAG